MRRPIRLSLGIWVVVCLLVANHVDASVRLLRDSGKLDLVVIGFAVFQTNLADDLNVLFDGEDGLPPELSGRQVLNLRVEGALSPGVLLDAKLLHDRENLRDWRYLARLHDDHSEIAIGELGGAFEDTRFTRYDTPFYGMQGRVDRGPVNVRGFVTERSGNRRVDRMRGTNLSGPYVLSASPILEGSERVVIEVRDRRDAERVLASNALVARRDYVLDHLTGTLQFDEPIEAETFDGDPVQIVVEYQFQPRTGADVEYLTGTRVGLRVGDGMTVGATYLRATGDGTDGLSEGVLGIDHKIDVGTRLTISTELAGPGGRFFDRREGALQVSARAKPSAQIEVVAKLARVGADLPTAADPRLESDLNRQHWELKTTFLPSPAQRIEAGYDERSDNVARDPEADTLTVRTMFGSWQEKFENWPQLGVRVERRVTDGRTGSNELQQVQLDLEDGLGHWPVFGDVALRGQYRFESESTASSSDTSSAVASHSARVRLDATVRPNLSLSLEARQLTGGSRRGREAVVGSRWAIAGWLSTSASLRHRREQASEAATTALFDLRWEPSDRFRGALKYEWSIRGASAEARARTRNLFGHVTVVPVRGLTATLGYKLDDRGDDAAAGQGNLEGEYGLSVRFDRIARLQVFGRIERGFSAERLPPFATTQSERRTALFGLTFDLTPGWALLVQLKREWLFEPVEARREASIIELSRALNRFVRLGAGVELTLDEEGDVSKLDRNRLYLKLIGRL